MLNVIKDKILGIVVIFLITALLISGAGLFFHLRGLNNKIIKLTSENNTLVASNKILEQNNSVLKNNNTTLFNANTENAKTIQQLKAERAESEQAVANLAKKNASDSAKLNNLNLQVKQLLQKNPSADGPVAPVLKEVISEIQKNRNE